VKRHDRRKPWNMTKPHHLDYAVAALSIQLTPDEVKHMEEAYVPHTVLGYS